MAIFDGEVQDLLTFSKMHYPCMPTWTTADQDECWFVFNFFFKEEFFYFPPLNADRTNKCSLAKNLQVVSDGHQEMDLPD